MKLSTMLKFGLQPTTGIDYSSPVTVTTDNTHRYNGVCFLTSTTGVIVYDEKCKIFTVSNGTVSLGDEQTWCAGTVAYIDVKRISDTQALICWQNYSAPTYSMLACVLSLSAGTVTAGSSGVIETVQGGYTCLAMLSSTKAVAFYVASSNLACSVLSVSGNSVTAKTPVKITTSGVNIIDVSCDVLSSTKAICVYSDALDDKSIHAVIVNVSGTTATPTSPVSIEDSSYSGTTTAVLSDTKSVTFFTIADPSPKYNLNGNVLSVDGDTITPGTSQQEASGAYAIIRIRCAKMDPNKALIVFRKVTGSVEAGFSYYVSALVAMVGSTQISFGRTFDMVEIDSGTKNSLSLYGNQAIFVYIEALSDDTKCLLLSV